MAGLMGLEKEFLEELKDRLEDRWDEYICDIISEVADSHIPIYYHDLLRIAERDTWLITEESDLWGKTALSIIQGNIYSYLTEVGYEFVEEMGIAE